jgi:hypothetical protein
MVLAHGFMEYLMNSRTESKIKYATTEEYWKNLKQEYLKWTKANGLDELVEEGWKEYMED